MNPLKEAFTGKAAIATVIAIVGFVALIICNWSDIAAKF